MLPPCAPGRGIGRNAGAAAALDVERRTANGAPAIHIPGGAICRAALVVVAGRSVPLCKGAVIATTTLAATAAAMGDGTGDDDGSDHDEGDGKPSKRRCGERPQHCALKAISDAMTSGSTACAYVRRVAHQAMKSSAQAGQPHCRR